MDKIHVETFWCVSMAGLAAREMLKTKGRSELSKALGQRSSDTVGDQLEGEDQSRWEFV